MLSIESPELYTHTYSTLQVFRIEALGTLEKVEFIEFGSKGQTVFFFHIHLFSLPLLYFAVFDESESYRSNTTRLELVENWALIKQCDYMNTLNTMFYLATLIRASLPPNSLHSGGNSALTLKSMLVTFSCIYTNYARYYVILILNNTKIVSFIKKTYKTSFS